MGNAAQFNPLVHYVDTGGVSDHVFTRFHLLGLVFGPRLRDLPDCRLACFGKPGQFKGLAPIMGKPLHETVILDRWDDVMRMTAGVKTRAVRPSAMLRMLGAYRQQNRRCMSTRLSGAAERFVGPPSSYAKDVPEDTEIGYQRTEDIMFIGSLSGREKSGAEGDRTPDLMTASHALSHLSYSPIGLKEEP